MLVWKCQKHKRAAMLLFESVILFYLCFKSLCRSFANTSQICDKNLPAK